MADNRDVFLGTDTTGADYYLVPRSGPGGHREVEIRKSKKQVPAQLAGLWTDAQSALNAFNDYMTPRARKPKATGSEDTE